MPLKPLSQDGLFELPVVPVANAFAGTVNGTVLNVSNYKQTNFYILKGAGASGTATITVNGCTDTSKTNATAVPFRYRVSTTIDAFGALTAATSAGFTTTAGANQIYEIVVDNDVLGGNNSSGTALNYIYITSTEVTASAVTGCIFGFLSEPRYPQATQATALT